MGLFGKRRKEPSPALPSLAGEVEVIVVGSEHYGDLRGVKEGPVAGVSVVPDPRNKYDRNAVAVHISGVLVGYLSAFMAERYRPMIGAATSVQAHARKAGGDLTLFVMLPRVR